MYQPTLFLNSSGIPIISNTDLDTLGERLVADFNPLLIFSPKEVDIDRFMTKYLHLKLDYQFLSHCGIYLGTTVFQETNSLPIYNPETHSAEFMHVDAGTVIIDSSLLSDNQEHRYRFTMGHEGSHSILHTNYYLNTIGENTDDKIAYVRCRSDFAVSSNISRQCQYHLPIKARLEQQANYLASVILMPKCTVKMALCKIANRGQGLWGHYAASELSQIYNVSQEAAFYRLKALNYIDKDVSYTDFI